MIGDIDYYCYYYYLVLWLLLLLLQGLDNPRTSVLLLSDNCNVSLWSRNVSHTDPLSQVNSVWDLFKQKIVNND